MNVSEAAAHACRIVEISSHTTTDLPDLSRNLTDPANIAKKEPSRPWSSNLLFHVL